MAVKAEAKPLVGHLEGGAPGSTVAVEPLLGGEVHVPRQLFESDGGRLAQLKALGIGAPRSGWWWAPVPAYLIHHPSAGPVLVDTALHPSVDAQPSANLGRLVAALTSIRMPHGDLPSQLRGRGVDPKSIRTVILTHLHLDHASGIAEFPSATFVLSAAEWWAATTGSRPLLHGYRRQHFDYLFDYRTIDFGRNPSIGSYASFGRTFDLFGDGSVRLAFTPGHTAGHVSVVARLAAHDLVIAGDAVYTTDQLAGRNVPPRPEDVHTWQRSRRELQRFSERFGDAIIVPGHDPAVWAELQGRYE